MTTPAQRRIARANALDAQRNATAIGEAREECVPHAVARALAQLKDPPPGAAGRGATRKVHRP